MKNKGSLTLCILMNSDTMNPGLLNFYFSEVGARGLLNLDHQNWETLMQSRITGPPF